ncbi:MAG: squalene/phytoene synthase family protein, partial [Planctomycetota bacterium]
VTPGEATLLRELPRLQTLLGETAPGDRARILDVVSTLIGGMRLDLERFPGEFEGELRALETEAELHDYCYRVAGCVGEFWSWIHLDHLRSLRRVDPGAWARDGVRLGHALQLTNVLRDVPRDLRHGRCYIPLETLAQVGLSPRELLEPSAWERLRPAYAGLLARALEHADAGLAYVLATPAREPKLRLAGALPLFLAVETLGVVWAHNPLDPRAPRKVSRRAVYALLARSALAVREGRRLAGLYGALRRRAGFGASLCPPGAAAKVEP